MAKHISIARSAFVVVFATVLTTSSVLATYAWDAADIHGEDTTTESSVLTASPGRKDRTLRFYVDESKMAVVAANLTGKAYQFGTITVWRSNVTAGPKSSSDIVGEIEGMNAFTGGKKHLVSSVMDIKTKDYEGTLSLLGAASYSWTDERDYAVVGGTGSFTFVRGKATFKQVEQGRQLALVELCLRFDV